MLFVAAGMGGGTGTGACAVIARVAQELGILTVGVVTKPFMFEGTRRQRTAEAGIAELKKHVDTMIVIPNQNLFRIANEKTTFAEAFVLADQVLYSGVACIVDLILKDGLINLDFADVRTVMRGMGAAMMGTGEASGERRAILAAEEAIANPLLDEVSLKGARGLLLSITGSHDMTLYEVDEAASRVRQEVDAEANIIVGATFDDTLADSIRVSIVASGMRSESLAAPAASDGDAWPAKRLVSGAPAAASARGTPDAPAYGDELSRAMAKLTGPGSEPPRAPMPPALPGKEAAARPASPPHGAARETWVGPGNVRIEAGYQPTHGGPAAPPPIPGGSGPGPQAMGPGKLAGDAFRPQAPVDVRRPARRMPDVEDFPAVGQREYYARNGQASEPQQSRDGTAASQGARRPGLFERIAGIGRRAGDSPASGDISPQNSAKLATEAPKTAQNPTGAKVDDHIRAEVKAEGEEVEMPMFFNKGRR